MLQKLSSRERLLILFAGGLLVALALGLLISLIVQKRTELHRQLAQGRRDVKTLIKLKDEIQSMSDAGQLPDQNQLLIIVTQAMQDRNLTANVRDRIEKVGRNDEKVMVEMSFSGIPLQPLFELLYDLEYKQARGISVGELNIRKQYSNRDIYDVRLTIYVLQPVKTRQQN